MERGSKDLTIIRERIAAELAARGLGAYAFLRAEGEERSQTIRSILVVLFPYYAGETGGNLSLYCRGMDYHQVVPRYLEPVAEMLRQVFPGETVAVYADTGPLRDRDLALRGGLGVIGLNHMLIHPKYGSYFFIAYITLSVDILADVSANVLTGIGADISADVSSDTEEKKSPAVDKEPTCLQCGKCLSACPGQVLRRDGTGDWERCRSGITQKPGDLADWEMEILKKDSMVFGCDICQTVCPMNAHVPVTPIPEFVEDRIDSLYPEDLTGLSRKGFLQKYPDRAFTWRGPEVIRRNLRILGTEETAGPTNVTGMEG